MKTNLSSELTISGSRSFQVTRGSKKPKERRLRDIIRDALPTTADEQINEYRIANLLNVWRGFWRILLARTFGIGHAYGAVYATVVLGNGRRIDLGLISLRVVTTAGVNYLVSALQNIVEPENMKFHGFGTGTTAEAAADTALVTELTTQYVVDNTRPTGSQTTGGSANVYRTVGTLTPDSGGVLAITEHGIFSASSAGVLLDRSKFAAINLDSANGDSLQITYDLTMPAGS